MQTAPLETLDYVMILLKILGTLGLLIFGMRMMSTALQKMAGPHLRHVLARMSRAQCSHHRRQQ